MHEKIEETAWIWYNMYQIQAVFYYKLREELIGISCSSCGLWMKWWLRIVWQDRLIRFVENTDASYFDKATVEPTADRLTTLKAC